MTTRWRCCPSILALFALSLLACSAGGGSKETRETGGMPPEILKESWKSYVQHFVQSDGRVIDYRAHDISTSEGQAYAMLRAVWINDRPTFDKTYHWAVNNLNAGVRKDHLWAWKWGQDTNGKWRALDPAFATDADQDAALALILASATWHDPTYLDHAHAMLGDLWNLATVSVGGRRYLLAGDSLCKGSNCRLNPSYYTPYAYRIFAEYDKAHDWAAMVDAAYSFLNLVSRLTATHLPPDWVQLNTVTGALTLGSAKDSSFSYDAFRTCWRVAMDYELSRDPRARSYLLWSLAWFRSEWTKRGSIAAVVSSTGKPQVEYQSFEMLAGVMPAMRLLAPDVAVQMDHKLESIYSKGIWGEKDSYYLQNWAWFGTALYGDYLGPFRRFSRH